MDLAQIGLVYDNRFLQHDTGYHPECAARLQAVIEHLRQSALWEKFVHLVPLPAETADLLRVHSARHVAQVEQVAAEGGGSLDSDTVVSSSSERVARLAAGAGIAAARAIVAGQIDRAFCAVRPPGHHATRNRAMGFCLYNNVAVLAAWLRAHGYAERVLIADFDVHHGNGTQDIFASDPHVWYLSMHQYPLYPGTGSASERGCGPAEGTVCNLPLAADTPSQTCVEIWREAVLACAAQCHPDWVLISAGFDAHRDDPLASLCLDAEDYALLTLPLVHVARLYARGRVISLLEGGYSLSALPLCVEQHVLALHSAHGPS